MRPLKFEDLTAEEVEYLNTFNSTGLLSEERNSYLLYDDKIERYIFMKNGEIEIKELMGTVEKLVRQESPHWRITGNITSMVPLRRLTFNPKKPLFFAENNIYYLNHFHLENIFFLLL